MKPIMLNGHTRALTQIKYNPDGDLLFSAAKDSKPCVWLSHNGERLGTYNGHNGTVWSCDIDYTSTLFLTGSADNTCKIWDAERGIAKSTIDTLSAVRTTGWSYNAEQLFISTDKAMGQLCELKIYNTNQVLQEGTNANPHVIITIPKEDAKMTSAVWGPLDETIVTGHENGVITKWDAKTGEKLLSVQQHRKQINDLQISTDQTMFITASKDSAAKLFDMETLEVKKTYKTERPVNSAAISPLKEHVVLGGGQDAMSVTTTAGKVGKFDARFYHMVFQEELGRVKGHFGPINTVAFHPNGKSYSSGGEDGYVRIHMFDPSYFEFEFSH